MHGLEKATPVKSASDFQQLSNELTNCDCVLTKLGTVSKLESQQFLCEVVNRLPPYVIAKWKRHANECKEKTGRYPKFHELVVFIDHEAQIMLDPIYGEKGHLHFPKSRRTPQEDSHKKVVHLLQRVKLHVISAKSLIHYLLVHNSKL